MAAPAKQTKIRPGQCDVRIVDILLVNRSHVMHDLTRRNLPAIQAILAQAADAL